MSEPVFDIVFYGIIQPGKEKETVIDNMAGLFKTTPEKIRPFFAGGRRVIKSGVDELTAEKYRAAMENAGLVIKIETLETEAETESPDRAADQSDVEDIDVAPAGADVLENRPPVEPQPIGDIGGISVISQWPKSEPMCSKTRLKWSPALSVISVISRWPKSEPI